MEALWRWTSSVFLLLALNISGTLSQNVGPSCPMAQTLQGEPLRECKLGLVPQLQINSLLLHPNGLTPGGPTTPVLECQSPACQDHINTQCSLNQQSSIPISQNTCANQGLLNGQALPRPFLQFSQPILPVSLSKQNPGLNSPLQDLPKAQGVLPGPLPTLVGPFTPQQSSPLCSQIDSSTFQNGLTSINHFTPLVPINPGFPLPCTEVLPSQGMTLQNDLPFPQFNMFRLPRQTLFQAPMSLQGPLSNSLSITYDVNNACQPIKVLDQAPIASNPSQIQQEPICLLDVAANILPGSAPNLQCPSQQSAASQPPLSPNPCLPPTVTYNPCANLPNGFGAVPPANNLANCLTPTPLNVFPSCFNGPRIDSSRLLPAVADVPIPINLQINVPPPVISTPRITIINATPAPVPVSTSDSSFLDLPYLMPPMIIEGRRSNSRSWLPLVLVALFASDGGYDSGCASGPIPVPYPIPIPTNNPVIVN